MKPQNIKKQRNVLINLKFKQKNSNPVIIFKQKEKIFKCEYKY